MKKVLLLKNVMEDEDIGIYSTLDNAKDKLIKIFNENISNSEIYYNGISEKGKQAIIKEIKEDINRVERSHTIEDFNNEMIDNYYITEWEIDE